MSWLKVKCHVEGLPQKHITGTYNPEDQMNTLTQL
jgi:hypothetical protein